MSEGPQIPPTAGTWTYPNGMQVSSPNLAMSWPESGRPLDAPLDNIRGFAENCATLADNFQTDNTDHASLILGNGETFSNGFPPGLSAQGLATSAAEWMLQEQGAAYVNTLAIAMASSTCADLLQDEDSLQSLNANDVNFAFADPNATTPGGLPSYLTGETLREALAGAATGSPAGWEEVDSYEVPRGDGQPGYLVTRYETADGRTREVRVYSDGSRYEIEKAANGSTLAETTFNGRTQESTTERWNEDGVLTSRTTGQGSHYFVTEFAEDGTVTGTQERYSERHEFPVSPPGQVGGGRAPATVDNDITRFYDAEGNLEEVTVQSDRLYTDGSREIGRTEYHDPELRGGQLVYGDARYTPERYFGPAHPDDAFPHGLTPEYLAEQAAQVQEDVAEMQESLDERDERNAPGG